MNRTARGPFDVTRTAEPAYDSAEGATLARSHFDKRFHGPLSATGSVEMLSAVSAVQGSAGYVAIERVTGSLEGRAGSFVLQHSGLMKRGTPSLSITVVPDTGSGELKGLSGQMAIEIIDGKHSYVFDYALEDAG